MSREKIFDALRRAYYLALIAWLSSKWAFQVTLGDRVAYAGREWTVINGVVPTQWSLWDESTRERVEAYRAECRKVWSWRGLIRSFRSGWHFYKTSWLDIWVNEGITPWMRSLPIWARRKT